ncbi:hypothetical protein [Yoonia sediminilitoris]|uniref:Uncharacterized protein n=1 Tax=Yoonia sediminilitoris TaxID=1286148 RepID=A0A2T6KKB1_9RHOB|nr:hypothetical protein [Yoonia sediminilitoris]PUB16375.1 hypothetical protein C8N45_103230 [Yoonia sediminilitoris]RCW96724.1 hypothetical protein DFP92_103230 [Yoonia sediminilitoris]
MGQEWIIDVLADLKTFAKQNELPLLAAQLEETALVASVEIAAKVDDTSPVAQGDYAGTRSILTSTGSGRRA